MASITDSQQVDLGEETGPRTVVSGLVNYIPIDQMRDKYLVAVVSHLSFLWLAFPSCHIQVQPQARQHAWREEFRDGALCRFLFRRSFRILKRYAGDIKRGQGWGH